MTPELRGCPLFDGFSDSELARVDALMVERRVDEGAVIVREDEAATELFVVCRGRVEVTKRAPGSERDFRLTTLAAGASFGELSLVDRGARSASVRALEPTVLRVLPMQALDRTVQQEPALRLRLLDNLSIALAGRLRGVSEVTAAALRSELDHAQARIAMGTFLAYVILIMVAYGFVLRLLADTARTAADTSLVTFPILLGFAVPLFVMMRRSGEPVATYGLTLEGAAAAARDALVYSLPVLALCTALKAVLVRSAPSLQGTPVFHFGGLFDPTVPASAAWFTLSLSLAYVALVPVQEFVVRGALQSPLQRFLVGRHATLLAIVIANAIFTASHLHLSATFALLAIPPGLLWGWLYARHRTLVAPVVSHMLIGWWVLYVLGFDRLVV